MEHHFKGHDHLARAGIAGWENLPQLNFQIPITKEPIANCRGRGIAPSL